MIKNIAITLFLLPFFLYAQKEGNKKKIRSHASNTYYFKVVDGKVIKLGKVKDGFYEQYDENNHVLASGYIGSDNILKIGHRYAYGKTGKLLSDSMFDKEGKLLGTRQLSYDSLDRITLYKVTYPDLFSKTYTYDPSGSRVVILSSAANYSNIKEIHHFDSLKRVVKEERFDENNKRYDFRVHHFDSAGNETENLLFGNDSVLGLGRRYKFNGLSFPVEEYIYEYIYKEWKPVFIARTVKGLIVESAYYDEKGKLEWKTVRSYNKKGQEVKVRVITKGKPDHVSFTKYDAHGKDTEAWSMLGNVMESKRISKYRYNEWGDVVCEEQYIDGQPVELFEYEYTYF